MRSPRSSSLAITVVMLLYATMIVRGPWQDGTPNIRSDVKGYWSYLRALFITHDLGHEKLDFEYLNETPEGTLNKYFAGESVLLLPFFLGAHAVAKVVGYPTDGLSLPYQRSIHLAAWIYVLIGLLCLRSLLSRMKMREDTVVLIVLILGLGTQLMQYTVMQPGWTHAYSFCAMSAFLLVIHVLATDVRLLTLALAGALFGLIVLLRPTNGVVLLAIPLIHGPQTTAYLRSLLQRRTGIVLAFVACAAVLVLQPLLWHAQTGQWFVHGYKGEGFYWSNPRVMKVLFSIRRGLFVWTPVMIIAATAVLLLWKRDRVRAIWSIVYWAVIIYVISAWWIWYYGGGFGHRAFIDHYPVLLLPLALWLDRSRNFKHWITIVLLALASGWHLMQFWQYDHGLLHRVSMDREKYAWSFLRYNVKADSEQLGGNDQEAPYHPKGMRLIAEETCDLEASCALWQGGKVEWRSDVGSHVCVLDDVTEFSTGIHLQPGTLPSGHMAHLVLDFRRYEPRARSSMDMLAVLSVEAPDGTKRYYEPTSLNPVPGDRDGQWRTIHCEIPIPIFIKPDDHVLFYVWNQQHGNCYLDDLHAQVWSVNPY